MKEGHPKAILLFRMGDFYEMFFDDAKLASRLLELTLTARGKGTDNVVPMCGFPYHQLESYTARLVQSGQRVAVCEQVEDPKKAQGLVRREVVRVVTPGTVTDPTQLDAKDNAWMAAVTRAVGRLAVAFLDLSTGEFVAWEARGDSPADWQEVAERLRSFAPKEIVYPEELDWTESFRIEHAGGALLSPIDPYAFAPMTARTLLERHFEVASLDGFGFRERPAAVAVAGGLLQYLQETQRCGLEHINELLSYEPSRFLALDPATRRNLELERSSRDGGKHGSLVHTLDTTVTASGGRLLRRWLLAPLLDPDQIQRRQDGVDELFRRSELRRAARDGLSQVHDIERLLARVVAGSASARELHSLRASLERLPALQQALADLATPILHTTLDGLDPCSDVASRLGAGLVDDPPATLRDGGVIRDGFNVELDELRAIRKDGRAYIASLEAREREATGIASFQILRAEVAGHAARLKAVARAVALIDVVAAIADVAVTRDYRRPRVTDGNELTIVGGRHPVVEQSLVDERFIPNDTTLEAGGRALAVLTGPNMGGKSTYLRQVALIALLAQSGSFVPAEQAELGIVDRIFCRVGASDSLSEGQSTFMVEMTETANILHHATSRSLVLLDEIGRGTSTFDGLSIAWAVIEHLHARHGGAPRTLFATHYHELTELAVELDSVVGRESDLPAPRRARRGGPLLRHPRCTPGRRAAIGGGSGPGGPEQSGAGRVRQGRSAPSRPATGRNRARGRPGPTIVVRTVRGGSSGGTRGERSSGRGVG